MHTSYTRPAHPRGIAGRRMCSVHHSRLRISSAYFPLCSPPTTVTPPELAPIGNSTHHKHRHKAQGTRHTSPSPQSTQSPPVHAHAYACINDGAWRTLSIPLIKCIPALRTLPMEWPRFSFPGAGWIYYGAARPIAIGAISMHATTRHRNSA